MLTAPNDAVAIGQVKQAKARGSVAAAQQWEVRADGWLIESTFDLKPGWDPSLAGESDATYSRSTNPDFSDYANVFRLWVLNEDGRFTDPPFDQGAPFDLTSFFGQFGVDAETGNESASVERAIAPQPLRFLSGLTLDDSGRRRPAAIQVSEDAGVSWSSDVGAVVLRNDRAAVYLDDSTLAPSFLAAAKAGDARVRITASLRSPLPQAARRWRGNPFFGTAPKRTFDVGQAFRFAKVAPTSLNYSAVEAGELQAISHDQSQAMRIWLLDLMQRPDQALAADRDRGGEAAVELADAWTWLRIGDRLINAGGLGESADRDSEATQPLADRGGLVRQIRCDWDQRGSPATRVELAF